MSEIPDGPAKIKILSREGAMLTFRFISFPEMLRQKKEGHTLDSLMSEGEDAVTVEGWKVYSRRMPEARSSVLFCPGNQRYSDDKSVTCKMTDKMLNAIVRAINARAKKRDWHSLKTRISVYRSAR